MTVRGRFGALTALAAATLGACQLIVGVGDEPGVARHDAGAAGAGGAGGGHDAGPDAEVGCTKARPPPPPSVTNAGDGPILTFAFNALHVRPKGEPPLGYDLDGRCTGDPIEKLGPACVAGDGGPPLSDDDGGVDNSFGKTIDGVPGLQALPGPDPIAEGANTSITKGERNVLLMVFDYNGKADDDALRVAIVASEGLESVGCGAQDAGTVEAGPEWMGCDNWSYVPSSTVVDHIPIKTYPAYVTNWVLVMSVGDRSPIEVPFGGVTWQLYGVMTANVQSETIDGGTELSLHGVFSGRVAASLVIEAVGHVNLTNGLICQSPLPGLVEYIVAGGCAARDIPLLPADDGKGKPCDAISVALGFDARPARLGDQGPPPIADVCMGFDPYCPDERDAGSKDAGMDAN